MMLTSLLPSRFITEFITKLPGARQLVREERKDAQER